MPGLLTGRVIGDWQYRHPLPHNQTLWKVVFEEGIYVMAGDGGVITTTRDLADWHSEFYPDLGSLDGLVYGNGGFLVTSRAGKVLTSPDGVAWTVRDTGTGKGLLSAAYGNGRYVLAGEDGTTATSTDGQAWTIGDTGDNNWYFGVAYGQAGGKDVFVAVSYDVRDGVARGSIATSADGQNWSPVTLPAGFPSYIEFYDVGYGGGKFIACGYFYDELTDYFGIFIATSADGRTWTRAANGVPQTNTGGTTPTSLNMIRYDGQRGVWVGVGDRSVVMTSADGSNWSASFPLGASTTDFFGIGFSPAGRVIVGDRADVYFSPAGTSNWVRKFAGSYAAISDIEFNGSRYVATGGAILTSVDGADWQVQQGWTTGGILANVVHGNGRWVAASRSTSTISQIPLTTSLDGASWTVPPTLPADFTGCQDLAFGNGVFMALPQSGANSLFTSTDGLTWLGRTHPWFDSKKAKCHITHANGVFLAFSTPGSTLQLAVSTDGANWTTTATALTGTYFDAAHGDGRWVLVGDKGYVATSTNLADWTEQVITYGAAAPVRLDGVAFGKGHWVISGRNKSIWSSTDGVNWTPAFTTGMEGDTHAFSSVLFDGVAFWTVGSFGDILRSSPLLDPATLSIHPSTTPRTVLLQIAGTPGDRWNILASPTLANPAWSVLTTVTLQSPTATVSDAVAGNRYYILSPP